MAIPDTTSTRHAVRPTIELPRLADNEEHVVLSSVDQFAKWKAPGAYLCTLAAADERLLEDGVFKIYYVVSRAAKADGSPDRLSILEYPLDPQAPTEYPSVRHLFASAQWLENEAADLYGLTLTNAPQVRDSLLHGTFPPDLYPLRQNRSHPNLLARIAQPHRPTLPEPEEASPTRESESPRPPHGVLVLNVGPIHAGIIQPGQFRFHVAGEIIEDLEIKLGYTHRGVEKLFATHYTLENGQELAERVAGDCSVGHALAYCQAVEELPEAPISLPAEAHFWRALLLEMERVCNHIGDVSALVHDMAFDFVASDLAVMREQAMRLNDALTGHRFLRGCIHPGGVEVKHGDQLQTVVRALDELCSEFLWLVNKQVIGNPGCRNRAIGTGYLTRREAEQIGATGLPARASGLIEQDFRLRHPYGAFADAEIGADLREIVRATYARDTDAQLGASTPAPSLTGREAPVFTSDLQGDVYARLLVRIGEVESSQRLIRRLASEIASRRTDPPSCQEELSRALSRTPNFGLGLGYTESWRGDIFYLIIKGRRNTIFRCQVRDPSVYNWPALRLAVIRKRAVFDDPHSRGQHEQIVENILADFPLINKSFNLSYAGHDR